MTNNRFTWARYHHLGYEVSSQGDKRYSALNARLSDGRTIEEAYQLDIKGYRQYGDDWRLGKGRPPLIKISLHDSYIAYLSLWRQWATENLQLMRELYSRCPNMILTDKFATTNINQARALADVLNELLEE